MQIRPASLPADSDPIWAILEPTIRAGETYTLPRDMPREEALDYWFAPLHEVFVAEENARILGTYFLQTNQQGGGSHVANSGYVTAPLASGRGVAGAGWVPSPYCPPRHGLTPPPIYFFVETNKPAA